MKWKRWKCNINACSYFISVERYFWEAVFNQSEKKSFSRQQSDRIRSFTVLKGFEQNLSTGILFLVISFLLIPQHTCTYLNV